MILDSSAILAILLREPGFEAIVAQIASAMNLSIGAPTLAETGIVLQNRMGDTGRDVLIHFIHEFGVAVIAFSETHWQEAVNAYRRFGKGRHKASLNFGDCMTYSIAKLSNKPLLCTGQDFSKTDLQLS
jgi:ribonuclease VapC